ncbi:ATP synthase subunit b (plasmid) [Caballeronia sp. SBC1]|uniref:F0F1 ATP synthase subunit delta n=1 Tax=unclassified Caballeronia TaxID=2646786 RepID=UPI0013E1BB10|nr:MULTISPECIES: F0F1 ATP synthase subunit delta [unclassified Caballeronia]QIE25604.1 ATP synthase subunit b [Caballeronia sp. SBC2]QIN65084.1 ATP synthase subunit b [Caballeronia sp. SBC1]
MHIDWWTLLLQTVNALVLVWLLARFLFRPVAKIVAERQHAAAALMADAAAAKAAALDEQQKAAANSAELAAQRAHLLEAATAEAAQLKTSLENAARIETEQMHTAAQTAIDASRREAAAADSDRASQFALDITARLLDRLPAEARIAGFIDGLARELGALPEATRAQLTGDGEEVHLIVPRALTDDELAACQTAFTHALGHPLKIEVTVDPTVIAGLELEAPHALVRNSFRHDLAGLKTELLSS